MSVVSGRSGDGSVGSRISIPLTRGALTKLRQKALRNRCWFRDLKLEERKLLELTIMVVKKVHSFLLAKLVSRIVSKLCEAMESRIFRLMKIEGRKLAEKVSKIGEAWGNKEAKFWSHDRGFIQYLTVCNLSSFKT